MTDAEKMRREEMRRRKEEEARKRAEAAKRKAEAEAAAKAAQPTPAPTPGPAPSSKPTPTAAPAVTTAPVQKQEAPTPTNVEQKKAEIPEEGWTRGVMPKVAGDARFTMNQSIADRKTKTKVVDAGALDLLPENLEANREKLEKANEQGRLGSAATKQWSSTGNKVDVYINTIKDVKQLAYFATTLSGDKDRTAVYKAYAKKHDLDVESLYYQAETMLGGKAFDFPQSARGQLEYAGLYDASGNPLDISRANRAQVQQAIRMIPPGEEHDLAVKAYKRYYKDNSDINLDFVDSADLTASDYKSAVKEYDAAFKFSDGYSEENMNAYIELMEDVYAYHENPRVQKQLLSQVAKAYESHTGIKAPTEDEIRALLEQESEDVPPTEEKKPGLIGRAWDGLVSLFSDQDKAENDKIPEIEEYAEAPAAPKAKPSGEVQGPVYQPTKAQEEAEITAMEGAAQGQSAVLEPMPLQPPKIAEKQGPVYQPTQTEEEPVDNSEKYANRIEYNPEMSDEEAFMLWRKGATLDERNQSQIGWIAGNKNVMALFNGVGMYAAPETWSGGNRNVVDKYNYFGNSIATASLVAGSGSLPDDVYSSAMLTLGSVVDEIDRAVSNPLNGIVVPDGQNMYEYVLSLPEYQHLAAQVETVSGAQAQMNEAYAAQAVAEEEARQRQLESDRAAILAGNGTPEMAARLAAENGGEYVDISDDELRATWRFQMSERSSYYFQDDGRFWQGGSAAAVEGTNLRKAGRGYADYKVALKRETEKLIDDYTTAAMRLGMTLEEYLGNAGIEDLDQVINIAYNGMLTRGNEYGADAQAQEAAAQIVDHGLDGWDAAGLGFQHGIENYAASFMQTAYMVVDDADYHTAVLDLQNQYRLQYGEELAASMYYADLMAYIDSGALSEESAADLLDHMKMARSIFDVGYEIDAGFLEGLLRTGRETLQKDVEALEAVAQSLPEKYRAIFNTSSSFMFSMTGMGVSTITGGLTGSAVVGSALAWGVPEFSSAYDENRAKDMNPGMSRFMALGNAAITTASNIGGTGSQMDLWYGRGSTYHTFSEALQNRGGVGLIKEIAKEIGKRAHKEGVEEIVDTISGTAFDLLDKEAIALQNGAPMSLSRFYRNMLSSLEETDADALGREIIASYGMGAAFGGVFAMAGAGKTAIEARRGINARTKYASIDLSSQMVDGTIPFTEENIGKLFEAAKNDLGDPRFRKWIDSGHMAAVDQNATVTAMMMGAGTESRAKAVEEAQKTQEYEQKAEAARGASAKAQERFWELRERLASGDLSAEVELESARMQWQKAETALQEAENAAVKSKERSVQAMGEWLKECRAQSGTVKSQMLQARIDQIAAARMEAAKALQTQYEAEEAELAESNQEGISPTPSSKRAERVADIATGTTKEQREAVKAEAQATENVSAMDVEAFIEQKHNDATDEQKDAIRKVWKTIVEKTPLKITGDIVQFASRVQRKFGVIIEFVDSLDGVRSGEITGNRIKVAKDATQGDVVRSVILHELTHKAEGNAKLYGRMSKMILDMKYGGDQAKMDADIQAKVSEYSEYYKKENRTDEFTDTDAKQEIVADYMGEILNGNEAMIERLVRDDYTLAQRIMNVIRDAIEKFKGVKDPQIEQMRRVVKTFEKALKRVDSTGDNAKYLITQDESNWPIVKADRGFVLGNDRKEWGRQIRDYIGETILSNGPLTIKTLDGEELILDSKSKRKAKDWITNGTEEDNRVRKNASAHLDEVVSVSEDMSPGEPNVPDDKGIHEWSRDGWRYHEAIFEDYSGKRYLLTISVGVEGKNKTAYNIGDVKEIEKRTVTSVSGQQGRVPSDPAEADIASASPRLGPSDSIILAEESLGNSVNEIREAKPIATSENGQPLAEEVGGAVTKYSLNSWTSDERTTVRDSLIASGHAEEDVDKWIADVDSVAAIVAADRDRLDFEAADNQVMLKPNQEYVKTLDASTLCAKRIMYQGTFNEIQHRMPDKVMTSDDLIKLRNMMAEMGYETPCGICYVESRRRNLGVFAQKWLDGYDAKGGYQPKLDDVTTTDGLERMRKEHPEVYESFTNEMKRKGSNNPKVVQLRTDYRGDIRSLTDGQAEKIVEIGGLRVQSFSDFETPHLLDMMQAVLDMTDKGLTSQAYTKVPNFAWVFGDTGIKINLSLIAEGNGLDEDGNLIFSSYEGMDFDEAMRLRDRYSENVGTILVGLSDAHIRAAMADSRIDFIIPFHKSGWGKRQLSQLSGMSGYMDYTRDQNERKVVGKTATGKPKTKNVSENFHPVDYWDYNKSGNENAETYLRMCEKDDRIPKFSRFLTKDSDGKWVAPDGYWKLLIDFKMYDNNGNGAPQKPVQPNFNMDEAVRVLDEYEGGANTLPVANDVVERFVNESQNKSKTKYSLPSESALEAEIRAWAQANQAEIDVAQSNDGVSQFAERTVQRAAVPVQVKQEFRSNPLLRNYAKDTNADQLNRAMQNIERDGYQAEVNRLLDAETFSAEDTVEAGAIALSAFEAGDINTGLEMALKYRLVGTEQAQAFQSRKMFAGMTPTHIKLKVAGESEQTLADYIKNHQPKAVEIEKRAKKASDKVSSKRGGDELTRLLQQGGTIRFDSTNTNKWGVLLNEKQKALIDHYKLNNVGRPGIHYNRATTKQRMLEAILCTPDPDADGGNGLTLIDRLEWMQEGVAVVTQADLNYIANQVGQYSAMPDTDQATRAGDLALARAFEAYGNINPAGKLEKARTWRYVSMLLSLPSAERNVIGNSVMNAVNAVTHDTVGVFTDWAVGLFTGQRTRANISIKDRSDGWYAWREETANTIRDYFFDNADATPSAQGEDRFNRNQRGRVYETQMFEDMRLVEGFLMSVGDRNFWKKAYVNSIAEQQRVADLNGVELDYNQACEIAKTEADYATFNEDGFIRNWLASARQNPYAGFVLDMIMPFTGVPTNITKRMVEYSPIGLGITFIRHAGRMWAGSNFDQKSFVDGISRGLSGTVLFALGMGLKELGVIKLGTGGEDDEKVYNLKASMGEQFSPFIRIGDENVSLATFAPSVSPIIMGATAYDILKDDDDKLKAFQNAAIASMDQILDASYMSGLSDLFNSNGSFAENVMNTFATNAISQNVPAFMTQIATALDPYVRDTKDANAIMQAVKSGLINRIPGVRQQYLNEKTDITGNAFESKEGVRNFIDPFTTTKVNDDPALIELDRLYDELGTSTHIPSYLVKTSGKVTILAKIADDRKVNIDRKNGEQNLVLTADERNRYNQMYSMLVFEGTGDKKYQGVGKIDTKFEGMRDIMESRAYKKASDEEKAEMLSEVLSKAKLLTQAQIVIDKGYMK